MLEEADGENQDGQIRSLGFGYVLAVNKAGACLIHHRARSSTPPTALE